MDASIGNTPQHFARVKKSTRLRAEIILWNGETFSPPPVCAYRTFVLKLRSEWPPPWAVDE